MTEVAIDPTPSLLRRQATTLWRRFGVQLALYFVLLTTLPLGLAVAFITARQLDQTREQVTLQLESVATLKRQEIDLWLEQSRISLDMTLSDFERAQFARLAADFDSATEAERDGGQAYVEELVAVNPYFNAFFAYNATGHILAAAPRAAAPADVTALPYFAASLTTDQYIHPLHHLDVDGDVVDMVITTSVRNAEGEIVGVLVGQLNIDFLISLMTESTGLQAAGQTYLVTSDRHVLPATTTNHNLSSEAIDTALSGRDGSGIYANAAPDPRRVIGVYRWVPELQAALIAEMSEDEALAAARRARDAGLAFAALMALLGLGSGLFFSRRLAAPLEHLRYSAQRIADGYLDERAVIPRSHELARLARSFNQMAAHVERVVGQYEQQVQLADSARAEAEAARAAAQRAERSKMVYLATMTHEMRAALNAIINFTLYVQKGAVGPINDKQRAKLNRVMDAARHVLNVINDVLDVAKIEAGTLALHVERHVEVPDLIDNAFHQAEALLGDKAVELVCDVGDLPLIACDRQRVLQILLNLLSNACKFTQQGEIKLTARRYDGEILISVADTGPGIKAEDLPRLFEPFQQTDTGRRHYGGTGLGLSISRRLAEAHGGRLWTESVPEHGATFHLALPVHNEKIAPLDKDSDEILVQVC